LLVYVIISENTDPLYAVGRFGAKMALWLSGVELVIRGVEKIPRHCAAVYIANHQGNCDPPALLSTLPRVRFLVKKEFFRVPILARAMLMCGFVPVDRKNREQAIAAVERAVLAVKAGHSFLAYAEGTRSPDGRLQAFKKGGFMMALKAGSPIVPVSISGSYKIMPKGRFAIRSGKVNITLHDPIPTEGYNVEGRQVLIDRVREAILEGLTKEEWPLTSPGQSPTHASPVSRNV
jgi:1-acyl-sn-glycerol-3-phosphate acyltransferase